MRWFSILLVLLFAGCASVTEQVPDEQVVQVSGNVYEILDVDRRGIFGSEETLKTAVYEKADAFARSKAKVAVPVAARIHRVGILGDWAWFWYQFKLVEPSSQEAGRTVSSLQIVRDARLSTEFYHERNKVTSESDVEVGIRKLDDLKAKGLLSDQEYREQKKRLLEKAL